MSNEIMLFFGEDGVAREYDDTWDISIHCESEEEQKAVWEKLKNSNREAKHSSDLISRQANCDYCHEDSDGYVTPLEKNCHAFIRRSPIDGWILSMKYGAWRKDIPIRFCPMCGRRLKHG